MCSHEGLCWAGPQPSGKGVDLIYIPRFVSIRKGITFCPKFLGLPDMIKNSLSAVKGRILTHEIRAKTDDISEYKIMSLLGISFRSAGELKKP